MIGPLVVLGMLLTGGPATRPSGATQVAYFDFSEPGRLDPVLPDGWTRVLRPGYPFFVATELTEEAAAAGKRSLAFRLNGGHCGYFSPPIPAADEFEYIVQGQIKTDGLENDEAFLLLAFYDADQMPVGKQHLSSRIGGTTDWTIVNIGPVRPESAQVKFVRLACFTQHGKFKDLSGSVYFDDLWIGRRPRVDVSFSNRLRCFNMADEKTILVRARGVDNEIVRARFALADVAGGAPIESTALLVEDAQGGSTADWPLPIARPGAYVLRLTLATEKLTLLDRSYEIAALPSRSGPPAHDFAISVNRPALSLDEYLRLMSMSGSKWLKLPLWGSTAMHPELAEGGQSFASFVERLSAQGMGIVGVLDHPTDDVLDYLEADDTDAAAAFSLPRERWEKSLDNVTSRYGLKINRWQLGGDDDFGFETLADPAPVLLDVQETIARLGLAPRLGVPWSWSRPISQSAPLGFVALSDNPRLVAANGRAAASSLAAHELLAAIASLKADLRGPAAPPASEDAPADGAPAVVPAPAPAGAPALAPAGAPALAPMPAPVSAPELWVHVAPLPERSYALETRRRDFIERVVAAKIGEADVVVASHSPSSLFDDGGAPNEYFVIWRNLADRLGGAEYLGNVRGVRGGSFPAFAKDRQAIIVASSDPDSTIEFNIGETMTLVDAWGRSTARRSPSTSHPVMLTPLPLFIIGDSEPLVRWQIDAAFERGYAPSAFGRQTDALRLKNSFAAAVRGRARMRFDPSWNVTPTEIAFEIQPGATLSVNLDFDIPRDAFQGDYEVPIEFELVADKVHRFLHRLPYRLGQDEVACDWTVYLDPLDALHIEAGVTNLTNETISLKSTLRAFNRNAIPGQIPKLAPMETAVVRFRIDNAADVAGSVLQLELEELLGRRRFNYAIPVGP